MSCTEVVLEPSRCACVTRDGSNNTMKISRKRKRKTVDILLQADGSQASQDRRSVCSIVAELVLDVLPSV